MPEALLVLIHACPGRYKQLGAGCARPIEHKAFPLGIRPMGSDPLKYGIIPDKPYVENEAARLPRGSGIDLTLNAWYFRIA